MKVGLIDVDCHAKKKKFGATVYPNLAQELIAQHHKSRVYPYAQPYRDPYNPARPVPQWQKDMAGWVNKKMLFEKISFEEFEPRKGFRCMEYLR